MKYYKILIAIIYFGSCQSIETTKPEINYVIKENQKLIQQLEQPNDVKKEIIDNSEINLFDNQKEIIKRQLEKNNEIIKLLYKEIEQKDQTIIELNKKIQSLNQNKYTFFDKVKLFFVGFITGIIFLFLSKLIINIIKLYYLRI